MVELVTADILKKIAGHVSIWGRSQVGKSVLAKAWGFAIAKDGQGPATEER